MNGKNVSVFVMKLMMHLQIIVLSIGLSVLPACLLAQTDPATEPAVLAVNKILPSVVNINTERIVRHTYQDPQDELFNQFFGGVMRPQREIRQNVKSLGSGFLVDPAGYIITNEHVVARAADLKIQVTMADGKTYNAKYIAGDEWTDLAFIKIESKTPLPFINPNDLSPNLLGQTTLVLGNPMGYGISVSRGILSALNRTVTMENAEFKNLIQTDAAINPGNSGGPIVDLSGKLMGVSSVKMAFTPQGVPTQGLGFGIPASTVRDKVAEFTRLAHSEKSGTGKTNGLLKIQTLFGIQLQELTPDLAEVLGIESGHGVLIADVAAGSSAAEAGLKRGVIIYKIGLYEVNRYADLDPLLAKVTPGTNVDFTVGIIRKVGNRIYEQLQTIRIPAQE